MGTSPASFLMAVCGPVNFFPVRVCIFPGICEPKGSVALLEPRIEAFTPAIEELLKTFVG
jgi:hypothetical protein